MGGLPPERLEFHANRAKDSSLSWPDQGSKHPSEDADSTGQILQLQAQKRQRVAIAEVKNHVIRDLAGMAERALFVISPT